EEGVDDARTERWPMALDPRLRCVEPGARHGRHDRRRQETLVEERSPLEGERAASHRVEEPDLDGPERDGHLLAFLEHAPAEREPAPDANDGEIDAWKRNGRVVALAQSDHPSHGHDAVVHDVAVD